MKYKANTTQEEKMSVKCQKINEFMALELELSVYSLARVYWENYKGGTWEFDTSHGYWLPLVEVVHLLNNDNFFEGELDARSAGIALSMMACSLLSLKHYKNNPNLSEKWGEHYYFLREYALDHFTDSKQTKIFSFLD